MSKASILPLFAARRLPKGNSPAGVNTPICCISVLYRWTTLEGATGTEVWSIWMSPKGHRVDQRWFNKTFMFHMLTQLLSNLPTREKGSVRYCTHWENRQTVSSNGIVHSCFTRCSVGLGDVPTGLYLRTQQFYWDINIWMIRAEKMCLCIQTLVKKYSNGTEG